MKKVLVIALGILSFFGCADSVSPSRRQKLSESRPLFGTIIKLDACYEEAEKQKTTLTFQEVWKFFDEMQWKMNGDDDRSDITKINSSQGHPVTIDEDTYALIQKGVHYARLTNGIFDITIHPLIELWKKAEKDNIIPTAEE